MKIPEPIWEPTITKIAPIRSISLLSFTFFESSGSMSTAADFGSSGSSPRGIQGLESAIWYGPYYMVNMIWLISETISWWLYWEFWYENPCLDQLFYCHSCKCTKYQFIWAFKILNHLHYIAGLLAELWFVLSDIIILLLLSPNWLHHLILHKSLLLNAALPPSCPG